MNETYVAEILQNKIYWDKLIYLKTSINEVIKKKCFLADLYDAQYKPT